MCDDLLFLENYFGYLPLKVYLFKYLTVNNNKLFPLIFWIFISLRFLYPNINGEYQMSFPKKKIKILHFLKFWPIPFEVLQTCCNIQKCKKIIFVFKKSMRKHIFKTSNIFYIKRTFKTCQGIGRMQHIKNIYFYIFFTKYTHITVIHN